MTINLEATRQESSYQQDYCLWLDNTVKLLRDRNFNNLDLDNLIAEIEAMSGSQRRELENRLRVLLMHLVKYKYQPDKRSHSWLNTIDEQRNQLELLLEYSPSLKPFYSEVFNKCYLKARRSAATETKLDVNSFPSESPFTVDETLNFDWMPE
ncbi:MAG TPA: DUF29 domain-containing protein [Oculatellaceae cyanobacterium]|jgi:hypothetical protein